MVTGLGYGSPWETSSLPPVPKPALSLGETGADYLQSPFPPRRRHSLLGTNSVSVLLFLSE